jgi:predicted AAA+ superfamily ATPase
MRSAVAQYPIISLTGPRQSGKTTLLRQAFADYAYINFEEPDVRRYFSEDPKGFLRQYDRHVIFDEAQRVPDLFSYLQVKTDTDGLMGQYILSGSQNFLLLEKITQSLAGRVAMYKLLPFSHAEMLQADTTSLPQDIEAAIFKGGYPALYDRNLPTARFFQNYIETYVERDVRNVLNIRDLTSFQNFMRLCAGRVGQPLNIQSLSTDAGISVPTVKNWLSILEASFILFLLPPFFENINKRQIKSPKLYFYDTGLLCNLLGLNEGSQVTQYHQRGSLFENMVIVEMMKNRINHDRSADFYFWQNAQRIEVDLVEIEGLNTNLYEMKYSFTPSADFFKGMQAFRSDAPEHRKLGKNIVLYAGDQAQSRTFAQIEAWRNLPFM